MRRRIVFLIPSLRVGGAQRQLIELATALSHSGWQVKVLTFYGGGEMEEDLLKRGVLIESLRKRGRWDLVGFSYRLLAQLRREHVDILHGYLGTANILTILLKPALPGVRMVWGVRASGTDLAQHNWLAKFLFRVGCWLSRFADLIICNSITGRDFHGACGYPDERMVVVPNGIDSERFKPDQEAREQLRREWAIGEQEYLVGLVARVDPDKDHATFLRAAAQVRKETEGVRFICVGDDPKGQGPALKRLGSDLGLDGHLIWAGARLDMPRVYSALDLAVSSSCSEGFPNVVAEAMATEIPCVVTDAGDSAYVVGDAGWVCAQASPLELAQAIDDALISRELLKTTGLRARQRVCEEFSVERLTASTSDHLSKLLGDTT